MSFSGRAAPAAVGSGTRRPLGSAGQLGLAINVADGNVYVVEDAHKLYPSVYEHRFEGLPVEVTGKVLKRDGKITPIQPAESKTSTKDVPFALPG